MVVVPVAAAAVARVAAGHVPAADWRSQILCVSAAGAVPAAPAALQMLLLQSAGHAPAV